MGHKNLFPVAFNWSATSPISTFLPIYAKTGSLPSGVLQGPMASTNVIYSQILLIDRMDNQALEVTFTGTATGTLAVMVSNSGQNFYALTIPSLAQPSGSSGGYVINLNQLPFQYMMLQYTNSSGSGNLVVYGFQKDIN